MGPLGPGRRRPHDMGPLIRWGLASRFKVGALARVTQTSRQAVSYHAKRHAVEELGVLR